jgi:hypothetical protein
MRDLARLGGLEIGETRRLKRINGLVRGYAAEQGIYVEPGFLPIAFTSTASGWGARFGLVLSLLPSWWMTSG